MTMFFSRFGVGLLAVLAMTLFTLDSAAARRLALVVGNSHYQNAPELSSPANDAQDIAQALRTLGFDVIERHDAGRDAMAKAMHDFADRVPGSDLVLLYFAGYGLQMNGENYLLPADVRIEAPSDVRFNTISLADVRGVMEEAGRTSIIMLDASRADPFADKLVQGGHPLGSPGLHAMEAGAQGSLLIASAQPNMVAQDGTGRNAPFTAALLKYLPTPGLEVQSMISRVRGEVLAATGNKQTPWASSSLVGDVFLAGGPAAGPSAQPSAPPVAAAVPPVPAVAAQASPPPALAPAVQSPPTAAQTETAAPQAASPPAQDAETECEKLAAFHMPVTSSEEVRETAATDWEHAAQVCRAEAQAHPGDPRFIYALGRAQDQLKNYQEALRDFRAAADAGHVDALVELGRLYYFGHGVLQSYPQAYGFFEKAMAAGSVRALANVAAMTGNGQGVPRDPVKALDLAERAIEEGNPFGLELVADAYFSGQGVPRDYKMAAQYLQQSADLGDGHSLKFLANMYESGYLGPPDAAKASELRLQAERVDPGSQDPIPAHLPLLRKAPNRTIVHRRRYVVFRRLYRRSYSMGQPMVGGIFKAPAPGARCCPPSALICPGALPRC